MIRWGRVGVVAGKELRDTLRDRRTLLMMVLVPALLYPLGGIAIGQLTMRTMARFDREGYVIAVEGPLEAVRGVLGRDLGLRFRSTADADAALRARRNPAALGLRVRRGEVELPGGRGEQLLLELLYDAASPRSRAALERARKALAEEAEARRRERLARLRLSEDQIMPLLLKERSVSSEGKAALAHLAPAIALLLILLSLLGAFYPAIDLIAGERERGTLEPLLCTPFSRLEIIAGKYVCLALLTICTCALNLVALGLTSGLVLRSAAPQLVPGPTQVLLLLLAATPTLLLVSALLILGAVFARSFKDAQNLMTPVYLACLLPAFGGLVPEVHLGTGLALVPVLSSILFIKDLLGGNLTLLPGFLAVASGLFYAALGVALAARVFAHADIGGARVTDVGQTLLVEPAGPDGQRAVTLTGALGVFGLCLALMLYVAPRLQLWDLRLGLLLTEVGLVLLPVLAAVQFGRVPLCEALGLDAVVLRQAVGALLAGLGGAALGVWLFHFAVQPTLEPPPEYLRLMEALRPRGPRNQLVLLGIGALLPALCEETLCRGLLLRAARRTLGGPAAVLLCAFLFAVLHIDPYRFLNALLLGVLFGSGVVLSGSLLTAFLMHLTNNALVFLLGDWLEGLLARPGPAVHVGLLLTAALGLVLGLRLLGPHAGLRAERPWSA